MSPSLQAFAAKTRRTATLLSATLLILLALLVGVGRELVKEIERFHAPLEQWLSERTHMQVRFSRIQGEWNQASPELHFFGVSVENPASPDARSLRIARLSVRVSLSNTLLHFAPRFRLRASGVEAHVERDNGVYELLGRPLVANDTADSSAKKPGALFTLLRHQPRISLYDSRLTIEGLYERRTDVALAFMKLFWVDQHALLDAEAMLRGPDEMKVAIKSDIVAVPGKQHKVQGKTYVALSQGQWTKWLPSRNVERLPAALQGGRGTTQVWLHWFNNELMSATLKVDWRDLTITPPQNESVLLDRVSGVARWQGQWSDFWQAGVRDLVVESGGVKWRPATLRMNARRETASDWLYQLSVANMSFSAAITPIMSFLPKDSAIAEALLALQPSGRLQDVLIGLRKTPDRWALVQAHGELLDYSQKPWQKVPGLQNAGVGFLLEDNSLWLDFNETAVTLDYPAMFRSPLLLTMAKGSVGLRWSPEHVQLRSSPLTLLTPDGASHTRISLVLPRNSSVIEPTMALQVTLRDFAAENASRYLPAGIIPEKLLAWLDGALKGGTLTRGDILFNGPLRKPEQETGRSVLLGFQVDGGVLQFLPEWQEPIRNFNGDVIVENGRVQAHAQGGEYYGLSLADSQVWTERVADHVHLHVVTHGEGKALDGLRLLRESPLGKTLKNPLSDMSLDGPLKVMFSLEAPLVAQARLQGQAVVSVTDAEFSWPTHRLEATNVELGLTYDLQKGLSTQQFSAGFMGETVKGRLYQIPVRAGRALRLEIDGKTRVEALKEWLQMPQLSLAKGSLPYSLRMNVPPAATRVPGTLVIKSSLLGVATDLPAPFAKAANAKRPLELSFTLGGEKPLQQLRYGDVMALKWETQGGRWKRGALHFGRGEPAFAKQKHWRVTGVLPRFRWSEWASTLERLNKAGETGQTARFSMLSQLGESRLTIRQLFAGAENLGLVTLSVDSDVHYVTLKAMGQRVQGRLTLPHTYLDAPSQRSSETPVSVYLQKLVLPAREQPADEPRDPALEMLPPPATFDPRLLPAAHLRIESLFLGDENWGSYAMTLKPTAQGVDAENVRIHLKQAEFTGRAQWRQQGDEATTKFVGRGTAGNVADVLVDWGYAPSIDSESALMDMDLEWVGAPYQFRLARTQGSARATLRNGHFLKVNNNAVGRVWGLLNFETWMSRMQLRFDDVANESMPFEEIRGRFSIGNNRVNVSRLRVDSPALKMRMEGLVDMSERQLNMQWAVTVPVTRNLMLPAAVVGGLPGAATAYVLDKVLSSQLDKLTTLTYDVTGTSDEPQTQLRIPLR